MKNRTQNSRFNKRYMLVWSCFYEFIKLILITLNYTLGPPALDLGGAGAKEHFVRTHAISARAHVGESTTVLFQFSIFY